MKKIALYALAISLLVIACQQKETQKEFAVQQLKDKRCFVVIGQEPFYPAGNIIGLENSYNLAWPEAGMLTPEAERELLIRTFGDSTATTFEEAAERLLYLTWGYETDDDEIQLLELKNDSIADTLQYTYSHLESTCSINGNLATFCIKDDVFAVGAAHGTYSAQYVTIDIEQGTIVHIEDLMDTSLLGEAIRLAVNDLDINEEVRECLFEDYAEADRLYVPADYLIDSTLSTITIVYPLYGIAPYACGIQSVILPVYWLAKHVPFTPYAKELFDLNKAEGVAKAE